MLDYTKAALKKTVEDFKKLDYIRNICTQAVDIAYLIYAWIAGAGLLWANIALFSLAAAYFAFFLIATAGVPDGAKRLKKRVRDVFFACKQTVKLFTLGVMIYGIYATTTHVTPLSVILSALMIVGWVLQVIFEVVFRFFLSKAYLIMAGMEADYEQITKPVKTVGNFFKKLAGKEVEPEKQKSKHRVWLDKKVAESKAEKKERKAEEKRAKKDAKKQKREDKKNTVYFFEEDETDEQTAPEPNEIFEENE